MTRVTPLNLYLLRLAALAILLGLLSGRPEPVVAAVPLLVVLWSARFASARAAYSIAHDVSAGRLFEGDHLTVRATVSARSALPALELAEPLPPSAVLVAGRNRIVLSLRPGEQFQWAYQIRCRGRGRFQLGITHVRAWHRSGLRVLEARHADPTRVRVCPRVAPLGPLPRPRRPGTAVGEHVSAVLGQGTEPGDIRPFAPGDQVRAVNWRASLRLGTLHVTRYQTERAADVVLMLDTLSLVGRPPATSLDFCVRAAASLAAAYLRRRDRVGLIDYGGMIRWVKPGSGRGHLDRLLDHLLDAQVLFTYVAKDLALVPRRALPPHALVIALSPLLDPRSVQAIADLSRRRFEVVTISVSAIALTRAVLRPSPLDDTACRLWALERRRQLRQLQRGRLTVLEWDPDEPLAAVLSRLAAGRGRRRAAAG